MLNPQPFYPKLRLKVDSRQIAGRPPKCMQMYADTHTYTHTHTHILYTLASVCAFFNTFHLFFWLLRGACPCSVNKTCVDPNQSCNCDVKENKWNSDEGYYQEPHSLGITNMYFLQQKDLDDEAQGRITLGPLECVETSELGFGEGEGWSLNTIN